MKIRNMVLVVGMMAFGGTIWAGCGSNPCQDFEDAATALAKKSGCSAFKPTPVDVSNCPTDDATVKALNCETACLNKTNKCDTAGLTALGSCIGKCGAGG